MNPLESSLFEGSVKIRICAHCKERKNIIARGCCSTCYHNPAIVKNYPKQNRGPKKGFRHVGDMKWFRPKQLGEKRGRMPDEPTTALPGTEEKMMVMRARLERGEHLYHPRDAVR